MRLSPRTRRKFADFCAHYATLRLIDEVFEDEGFDLVPGFEASEFGERRSRVRGYHEGIDLDSSDQVQRLVRVYLAAVDAWGRDEEGALWGDARAVVKSLQTDGFPVSDDGTLTAQLTDSLSLDDFHRLAEPMVLSEHLRRISDNVSADPPAAIGSAKELVESVCKFVLDDYGTEYAPGEDLLSLYKKTAAVLRLNREAVPDSVKGSEAARKVLQNLATAVHSLAELRNELGLGHGRTASSPALARHGRLAYNASRTVVEFILETWHVRRGDQSDEAEV